MASFTELYQADLEHILAQYGLGTLVDFRETEHGIENTNYFVRIQSRVTPPTQIECVLTVLEERERRNRVLVADCLERCRTHGLPVPSIVRTTDGDQFGRWKEKAVLLSERIPGNHVVNPTNQHCAAIGRFLARAHLILAPITTEFQLERDIEWLNRVSKSCEDHLLAEDRRLLRRVISQLVSVLTRRDVEGIPQGVIHGDLFRDNVLFNQHGLCGVLDFHHAGASYWMFDLAVAINDWCWNNEQLEREKTITMLRAYNSIRTLEPMEYWSFPQFLLYASVCFWLSRLEVAIRDDLPDNFPRKDPDEFAEIVREHLQHPFQIHELAIASGE